MRVKRWSSKLAKWAWIWANITTTARYTPTFLTLRNANGVHSKRAVTKRVQRSKVSAWPPTTSELKAASFSVALCYSSFLSGNKRTNRRTVSKGLLLDSFVRPWVYSYIRWNGNQRRRSWANAKRGQRKEAPAEDILRDKILKFGRKEWILKIMEPEKEKDKERGRWVWKWKLIERFVNTRNPCSSGCL